MMACFHIPLGSRAPCIQLCHAMKNMNLSSVTVRLNSVPQFCVSSVTVRFDLCVTVLCEWCQFGLISVSQFCVSSVTVRFDLCVTVLCE